MIGGPVDILVVDDNENERMSIVAALDAAMSRYRVVSVRDGADALDFLFCRGEWSERAGENPPGLILMDLDMPNADGFSVLGQIRSVDPQDRLTLTPVVIFTDSTVKEHITESYRLGANSFISKPLRYEDFQRVVEAIGQYWLRFNQRPPESSPR